MISRPRTEGTTSGTHTARGFGCGKATASVAALNPHSSGWGR